MCEREIEIERVLVRAPQNLVSKSSVFTGMGMLPGPPKSLKHMRSFFEGGLASHCFVFGPAGRLIAVAPRLR